jgi:hypothetical protein
MSDDGYDYIEPGELATHIDDEDGEEGWYCLPACVMEEVYSGGNVDSVIWNHAIPKDEALSGRTDVMVIGFPEGMMAFPAKPCVAFILSKERVDSMVERVREDGEQSWLMVMETYANSVIREGETG